LVTLPKSYWPRILGSAIIQLYAGECRLGLNEKASKRDKWNGEQPLARIENCLSL